MKLSGPYRGSTQRRGLSRHGAARQGALRRQSAARALGHRPRGVPNTSPDARNADTGLSPRLNVDDVAMLNQLAVWIPSDPQRRVVLVDNPARLYGW